jgi:hypothetical protein
MRFTVHVADEVDVKLELEVETDERASMSASLFSLAAASSRVMRSFCSTSRMSISSPLLCFVGQIRGSLGARSRRRIVTGDGPHERANAVSQTLGQRRRWRNAGMLGRDAHSQDQRADREPQGWLESHRLAVDSGGNGLVGANLERWGAPLAHRSLRRAPALATALGARAIVTPSRPSSIAGRVPEPTARPSR